jgi:hypothetical protein
VFPSAGKVASLFYFETNFFPLPAASDFRVQIGDEAANEIRGEIERNTKDLMDNAMGNLWERLHECVSAMAERLSDPKKIFRDSLVKNVIDLCDLLPGLNVTGDAKLEQARADVVARLTGNGAQELRDNKIARRETAQAAVDILKQMEALGFAPEQPAAAAEEPAAAPVALKVA